MSFKRKRQSGLGDAAVQGERRNGEAAKRTRRQFLGGALLAGLLGKLGCGKSKRGGEKENERTPSPDAERVSFPLAEHPPLAKTDGMTEIPAEGNAPSLVLLRTENGFRAYVNVCTHAACPLEPDAAKRRIYCDRQCGHGSIYGLDGKALAGPSARPLYEYFTEWSEGGDSVTVVLELKNP